MKRTTLPALVAATAALAACTGSDASETTGAPRTSPLATATSDGAASPSPTPTPTPTPTAKPKPKLKPKAPWGTGPLLPDNVLVGFAGHQDASALGILGVGELATKGKELRKVAKPYAIQGRKAVPVFEFLATLAHRSPGKDGKFRGRAEDALVRKYLRAARKANAVLLLGIQPGQADFLPEVKAYEKFLKEPDVGVALDPEWATDKGNIPGEVYGRTTGKELDGVSKYLARLVEENDLPEKVMVYHQLRLDIVEEEQGLKKRKGVVPIKSIDGIGSPGAKTDTFNVIARETPKHVKVGFKLFYEEDIKRGGRLMRPKEILGLKPRPVYVLFE